jgi:hypothetical protein
MSPGIESGLFAIIGAAVGALGAALTGIIQSVMNSRARRAERKAEAAAKKVATQLEAYQQLIGTTHDTRNNFLAWRRSSAAETDLDEWNGKVPGLIEWIEITVGRVRLEGTDRAAGIAAKLQADMEAWLDEPSSDRFTAEMLTAMIAKLERAEDELTALFRQTNSETPAHEG